MWFKSYKAKPSKLKEILSVEKEIRTVSKVYNVLLLFAGLAHTGGPLLIILISYIKGTYTSEIRFHPFKGM